MTIGRMLRQILSAHGISNRTDREQRSVSVIEKVGLSPVHLKRFPHEFSGGQRQRIAIAMALILNPKFIVVDEPSSALDMSIQAQILNLMKSLQKELGISYLFITHNLSAARFICNRIAVMYLGKIVESADRKELLENPKHTYTQALLDLFPRPDADSGIGKVPLTGEVPSPINLPQGCRFRPRCVRVEKICREKSPDYIEMETGHGLACHMVA